MTPHLKGHVRAYVDRALPPAMLHLYDKHLVCCTVCRAAADQERRIVAALRSDTGVPMSLRTSLMGLAAAAPRRRAAGPGSLRRPPRAPAAVRLPYAVRALLRPRAHRAPDRSGPAPLADACRRRRLDRGRRLGRGGLGPGDLAGARLARPVGPRPGGELRRQPRQRRELRRLRAPR